jgi:nitrogen fixation protein FixH
MMTMTTKTAMKETTAMAMIERTQPAPRVRPITGWHVLTVFGAMFAVMLAVNITFVVLALKTFSGETDHAYINGLRFNETLAAKARQAEMGWTMSLGLTRPAGGGAVLEARLVDRDGAPLSGAMLSGMLERTTQDNSDRPLMFTEDSAGTYRAVIDSLEPGRWRFEATAAVAGYPDFSAETTLSLR